MAWNVTPYDSEIVTAFDAGYPVIVPRNLARDATLNWGRSGTTANQNDSNHPPEWAANGIPLIRSWSGLTAVDSVIELWMEWSTPIDFDFMGIFNHNLDEFGSVDVHLEIADDNAFSVRDVEIATPVVTTKDRIIWRRDGSNYYTNVVYLRVFFEKTGGGTWALSEIIKIGELYIGKRVQLPFQPSEPWDPDRARSTQTVFKSDAGAQYRLAKTRGLYVLTPRFQLGGAAFDDRAQWDTIWNESRGFTQAMVWCEDMKNEEERSIVVNESGLLLDKPYIDGPEYGELQLTLEEQPPGYLEESGGW